MTDELPLGASLRRRFRRNLWLLLVPLVAGLAAYHDITPGFLAKASGVGLAGGLAGGLIAGAIGLVSVPLITLFLGLPIHAAAATNLFQTVFTAASGAATHARHWRLSREATTGSISKARSSKASAQRSGSPRFS